MSEIQRFALVSDKIIGEIFAENKKQLTVYSLEKDVLIESLFNNNSTGEVILDKSLKAGETATVATIECINIVVTLFHLYTHFRNQKKQTNKDRNITETLKDITPILDQNGLDIKTAEKIITDYEVDILNAIE